MADAKKSVQNAVTPLIAGAVGAGLGHFAGKGKNLILGGLLLLGADVMAEHLPDAVTPASIRTAGTVALLVNPAAASGSNQSLADFAKDGVNRLKGFANATVMGAGVAKGPFTLSSGTITAIPIEGTDFVGETPYYLEPANQYSYVAPQIAVRATAGR